LPGYQDPTLKLKNAVNRLLRTEETNFLMVYWLEYFENMIKNE
jgi:hypothetical protein